MQIDDHYHDRQDEAGRLTRRLPREMDSLWVFLVHHGVEPTNKRSGRYATGPVAQALAGYGQ